MDSMPERSTPAGICAADALNCISGELQSVYRLPRPCDPAPLQRRDRHQACLIALQQRERSRQLTIPLALSRAVSASAWGPVGRQLTPSDGA